MDLVIYGRMDQIYGLGGFDRYDDKYNVEEDDPPTLSVEREGRGEVSVDYILNFLCSPL